MSTYTGPSVPVIDELGYPPTDATRPRALPCPAGLDR
jgi:hypothetical protein